MVPEAHQIQVGTYISIVYIIEMPAAGINNINLTSNRVFGVIANFKCYVLPLYLDNGAAHSYFLNNALNTLVSVLCCRLHPSALLVA